VSNLFDVRLRSVVLIDVYWWKKIRFTSWAHVEKSRVGHVVHIQASHTNKPSFGIFRPNVATQPKNWTVYDFFLASIEDVSFEYHEPAAWAFGWQIRWHRVTPWKRTSPSLSPGLFVFDHDSQNFADSSISSRIVQTSDNRDTHLYIEKVRRGRVRVERQATACVCLTRAAVAVEKGHEAQAERAVSYGLAGRNSAEGGVGKRCRKSGLRTASWRRW